MATASSTEQQAAQAGIVRAAGIALAAGWRQWLTSDRDPRRLKAITWALAVKHGRSSAGLAGRYYLAVRQSSGLPGGTIRFAPDPTPQVVARLVDETLSPLLDLGTREHRVAVLKELDTGLGDTISDTGRATLLGTIADDRSAKGWARIPEPDACAFCALLATRGVRNDGTSRAVYRADTVKFAPHPGCRCAVEPVFNAYEPSAQIREWTAMYAASTKGVPGGGTNLLNAFRRAYEGRTP